MPGTFRFSGGSEDVSKPQPPPVAPRVTVQSWQPTPVAPLDGSLNMYGNHVRSGSVDSLDSSSGSSVSSSSSSGSHTRQHSGDSGEFIPTRTLNKNPSVSAYNPLQFVKVQSPLYRKAEQQIKLAKEVKIARGTLKEGEEEWQSNLDNWKSRRRKVSERVFQRAEEMRQIEAEEQLRQHQQQQRKIKTFSEIVEKRSQKKHNYNFDLYMGQGDDSGLGATPEPEDQDSSLDNLNSTPISDVSEDVTSESESVDSDARCSEKTIDKEPPEVPKKPYLWLSRKNQCAESFKMNSSSEEVLNSSLQHKEIFHADNPSSAEPSDIEGHAGDIETLSSEDDAGYCGPVRNADSGLGSLSDGHRVCDVVDSASDFSQDSCTGLDKANHDTDPHTTADDRSGVRQDRNEVKVDSPEGTAKGEGREINMKLFLKQSGDSKGFGFSLKGGKDQSSKAYIDSISPGGAAEAAGLHVGDVILSINGEKTCSNSHSSLVFAVKQAVYIGQLDLVIWRHTRGSATDEMKMREEKETLHKKGSSFADKIAMFSNGVSSHTTPCPPPVAPRTSVSLAKATKPEEPKKESLVFRRKSAFECSPAGDQVKKRWSSCVSSENSVSSKLTNGERRHSLDFTKPVDKLAHTNCTSKKAPPPPVPVKPKVKSRVQNSEHHASCDEVNRNKVDVSVDQSVSRYHEQNVEGKSEDPVNICKLGSVSVPNGQESVGEPQCTLSTHLHERFVNADVVHSHSESVEKIVSVSNQVANNVESSPDLEESSLLMGNTVENVLHNIPESPDHSCEKQHFESSSSLSFMHSLDTQDFEAVTPPADGLLNTNESAGIPVKDELSPLATECNISDTGICSPEKVSSMSEVDESWYLLKNEQSSPSGSEKSISSDEIMYTENLPDNTLSSEEENSSPVDSVKVIENTAGTEDLSVQLMDVEQRLDHLVVDADTNFEGRENHFEMNVPPLCLTLEKIDEDDVVSASTTTSSETPDTETVIEHFPSNVSPLPNDDIISENLNIEPQDSSFDLPLHTVTVPAAENNLLPMENSIPENSSETNNQSVAVPASENEVITEHEHVIESSFVEVESATHFRETFSRSQDDDVPLTEDVIDEIEMRLMQQLEQQVELEDMSADQDVPLEDEVNRQLMYLSDDADLLEDLDAPPRHVVPPSEPPPPPPPPEMEAEENKTPPLMRVNSTKRIKKEIYRRRSDFLGLDSGEGIDIDNIPPRPPGLEELYKSEMEIEREQRLWLEKRLSLAEPLPGETSFDAPTSVTLNSDYTYYPDNMPEVLDAEVFDAVASEYTGTEKQELKEVCPQEESFLPQSPDDSLEKVTPENPADNENVGPGESPQHKAKQHIQSLGAAPRAKIMDSDKWITQAEKNPTSKRRSVDPVFQENRGTQNFWLAKEAEKRNSFQRTNPQPHNVVDRRYSMPPAYSGTRQHPDVTVRTWGDREPSFQQRPKSAVWDASSRSVAYDPYLESCYSSYSGASRVPLSHSQYETQAYSQGHPIDLRRCSYCREELTDGSAMGIEALQLYFHIECFHCCVCGLQLGNGSCGTDVQVKNNQLYCPSCFTLD